MSLNLKEINHLPAIQNIAPLGHLLKVPSEIIFSALKLILVTYREECLRGKSRETREKLAFKCLV